MKAKHVFTITGLSLAMVATVLAGRAFASKDVRETSADSNSNVTLYFDVSSTTWWNDANAETHAHYWGGTGGSVWPGTQMTLVEGSTTKYSLDIPAGHTKVIFTRVDPADHTTVWNRTSRDNGTAIDLPADFSVKNQWNLTADGSNYDDGNYCGNWSLYSPDVPDPVYKYSLNGATAVTMTKGSGSEVESAELTFAKGDVVTFLKDDAAYAVEPKEDGAITRVYSTEDGLKFAEAYTGKLYLDTATAKLWADTFTPGYYLTGSFVGWEPKLGVAAALEGGEGPAYVVEGLSLAANSEIKFVQFPAEGTTLSWKDADGEKVHTDSEVEYEVLEGGNLKVITAGTYDVYYNPTSGWYSIEDQNYVPDVPADEGYYICGLDGWRYENAIAMTQTSEGGNVAYKMNLGVKVDDEIRVRSYLDAQEPKDRWAEVGNGEEDFGEKDGNNFKFTKAGHYDIYAKYEGNPAVFKFYVAEHVDTYEIQLTAVKFSGKSADGSQDLASRTAYAGSKFVPTASDLALEGYVAMGIFKDETLEKAYPADGEVFSAAGHLYVKYMKVGYYMVGDEAFSGTGKGWSVEGATYLPAAVNDTENNLYEGTIVIPASASTAAVEVRPALFTAEGTLDYNIDYSIAEYSFAEKVGNNIQFTKGGTFAVYVNKSYVVYLNEGLDAFNTKFLTDMGAVCTAVIGGTKDLDDIKAKWAEEKIAYLALSKEEKDTIKAIGFDGGNEKGDDLHKVIAKYAYIVTKYGTVNCEDFIWGQNYEAQSRALNVNFNSNNAMLFAVIGTISLVALASVIVLKKKKTNR